jgi:hypothetical protein
MTGQPEIKDRFIFRPRFKGTPVPILNADGHVDYAHQIGFDWSNTKIIEMHSEKEEDGSVTRWATVKVTVSIGGKKASGISCANTRDQFVKQPGYEVAVAETRALKRAIALAANITEDIINPKGKLPTREFVDMPIRETDIDDDIPADIKKKASDIIDADAENFNV